MTLDASGNLLVGTTSATYSAAGRGVIEVNGSSTSIMALKVGGSAAGYVYHDGSVLSVNNTLSGSLAFATNGSERARIDSSGNFLVGTTTTGLTPSAGFGFNASQYLAIGHANGTGNGTEYVSFAYNSTKIGSVTQSGTTAVLYNVTSDQRLKTNIQDADDAASLVDSLQVRKFDWKADGNHQRYGFIAQELVTVAPEAVHQPANPDEMMAVDYSKLVPMLVKEIQSLRKRLAAAGI
jgi:hypothetical protein